ncbi:MAG: ribosomal RNA small subunit methyltransferase A [Dehalococcoidia bacterium]|nr:MAG: ribosomal RNA small subunit methyltransferase A [Dehalococcoidia bacterium]
MRRKADNSRESSLARVRSQLRRLRITALKELGQHFLVDNTVLETIISASELSPSDVVVEVGPGLGILTEELVKRAGRTIAVEIDTRLATALNERFPDTVNLTVVNADMLDLEPVDLVGGRAADGERSPHYKVVANLPYYVALPILRHFLEASLKPALLVVMVQKEVAENIVAEPGALSLMGVSVQLYGKATIMGYVPAQSFYPQPKVDSAIVRIDVYPEPAVDVKDVSGFFEVVKAGFSAPRKQIRNSLALGLELDAVEVLNVLTQAGIDPHRRPQTLSLEEWAALQRALVNRGEP